MLDGDVPAVLLSQKSAHYWAFLLPEGVSRNVVGDGEEDEGVQDCLELGALLARDERVGFRGSHDALQVPREV